MSCYQDKTPHGYIIRNDGIFGEWSVWRDDDLGTIVGDGRGFATREAAVAAAYADRGTPTAATNIQRAYLRAHPAALAAALTEECRHA